MFLPLSLKSIFKKFKKYPYQKDSGPQRTSRSLTSTAGLVPSHPGGAIAAAASPNSHPLSVVITTITTLSAADTKPGTTLVVPADGHKRVIPTKV